jgi:hypothetical protein
MTRGGVTDAVVPYVIIPVWLLTAVSPRAVVVYGALGSYADNRTKEAWPSMATIGEAAGCSETIAREAIHELERVGAVKVERTVGGTKQTNRYVLDAMNRRGPRNPPESRGRNPSESRGGTRLKELEAALPLVGDLQVGANTTPRNEFGAVFDLFWDLAVRKSGKAAARSALKSAMKKADLRTAIGPAWRQANEAWATWPDKTKVPHPSTWLNQERWDDDPVEPHSRPVGKMERADRLVETVGDHTPDEVLDAIFARGRSPLGSVESPQRKEIGR